MTECRGVLEYEGCNYLRQRLILATLSGRSVRIKDIRNLEDDPGLKGKLDQLLKIVWIFMINEPSFFIVPTSFSLSLEFEVNLLKLLDQITNGSKIDINPTGTALFYQPGLLQGGRLELDCGNERGLGYFLEPLICLAPFVKKPVKAVLRGVTNSRRDPSVDLIKSCWLPVVKKFTVDSEGLDIKVQ